MPEPPITPKLPTVAKVSAFITRGRQLLVFRKPFHPGTGTQVPAGTIEPDETPEHAVIREATEETGLTGFVLRGLLTHRHLDMRPYGRAEIHDRWFFHLDPPADAPERWRHGESDPSAGTDPYIPFDFFWLDVEHAAAALRADERLALPALRRTFEDGS